MIIYDIKIYSCTKDKTTISLGHKEKLTAEELSKFIDFDLIKILFQLSTKYKSGTTTIYTELKTTEISWINEN